MENGDLKSEKFYSVVHLQEEPRSGSHLCETYGQYKDETYHKMGRLSSDLVCSLTLADPSVGGNRRASHSLQNAAIDVIY